MDTERLDRLDALIRENRIIRGAWTERDRACLLAALAPEAGKAQSASACPAEVMPAWLAHLTPWIDDAPSEEAWSALVGRYAALARRWHVLDTAAWERARIGVLIAIVTESRQHVLPHESRALAAIDGVLAWLRRGAPEDERLAALWAAEAAQTWAATWAARSAAETARSAAEAAQSSARSAVASAAEAAAAVAAAADRLATAVLDAIEAEIVAAEGRR